jgi:Localisation of periplasmic protein complexes.
MRKQLLVFLPLLVLATMAAAETQSTGSEAPKRSALIKVQAVPSNDGLNLELTTRGDVSPKVSELDSPARIVLDMPNTFASTAKNIIVDSDGVKRIRVGMDGQNSPTTRVVIDLTKLCQYELTGTGNNLVLKLHTNSKEG